MNEQRCEQRQWAEQIDENTIGELIGVTKSLKEIVSA